MDLKNLLTRRVDKIYPSREGLEELISQRKIRLYLGIDPTGFQLHIGHGVVLKKIQEFIDDGHEVIFLVGSFTGKIGDPSDREAERVQLTDEQIEKNMADYRSQAGKLVDFSRAKFVYNGDWLSKLTFEDVVNLASHFTVQQMIEREMFQKRLKNNKPIHLHEFLYPLMQGYDSVYLEVDLEIGGSDQLFNMIAGRTLLKAYKNKEKFVLTTPLLMGTNGQKMSKSIGNCVWLTDSAEDMFGKLMSIPDDQIVPYLELVTDVSLSQIKDIKQDLSSGKVNPVNTKKDLATDVVTQFHGSAEASRVKQEFERTFQEKQAPASVPIISGSELGSSATLIDAMLYSGTVRSRGEAKRLISQGSVSLEGSTQINNPNLPVSDLYEKKIQVGKRRWFKITK